MDNFQDHPLSFRNFHKDLSREKNGHSFPGLNDDSEEEMLLTDEMDHEILMHRDAHFGGDFRIMLDYYLTDHIGINPDFELERIQYLAEVENQLEKNLAPMLLSGAEAERVAKARQSYQKIKASYDEEEVSEVKKCIADLLLSEEEEPEKEIEAIVKLGSECVPYLISIVDSQEAYDPLFPGYGYGPYLAIVCLGQLRDPKAIPSLFETLSRQTIFGEEVVIDALAQIGEIAKKFLLRKLSSRPLNKENVNAAFALSAFSSDPQVAQAALEELQDSSVREKPLLSIYLLCCCEGLRGTALESKLLALAKDPMTPLELKSEIEKLVQEWHLSS